MIYYSPSIGLYRLPHIKGFMQAFTGEAATIRPIPWGRVDAAIGWGRKDTSIPARSYAQKKAIPYIALEDGFLRSFGLGVTGTPPLSLVMDKTGIYYDAQQPSDLETLINDGNFSHELLTRAEMAMNALRTEKLVKYNQNFLPLPSDMQPIKRLIIDQTAGDASVVLSGADHNAFEQMVRDALAVYSAEDIAIKLHPDTLRGHKSGYLRILSTKYGIRLIDQNFNPWDLLSITQEVATISSQFGFDALMAGCKTICYGMPFYAGWGLTQDKVTCPRRTRTATLREVFAASYILYARYIDPFTGEETTLENTINLLADTVRMSDKVPKPMEAIGFSPWKRWFLPQFTGGRNGITFSGKASRNNMPKMIWASRNETWRKQRHIAKTDIQVEDGFIRSNGLGVKLTRPWSIVFDRSGIYYDPRQPSDLETLLQANSFAPHILARAETLRQTLTQEGISKYNIGKDVNVTFDTHGKRVILVPGQVEDDASIRTGTIDIKSNLDLLQTVRAAHPDAYIIYKPHPDVEAGKRRGKVAPQTAKNFCDTIVTDINISTLWPLVDEVHTMTSLTGFEALLRDKKVYCYGIPFYAGWGLTQDYFKTNRRTVHLTINALVAGTLIMYPSYIDWNTKQFSTAENVIRQIATRKRKRHCR